MWTLTNFKPQKWELKLPLLVRIEVRQLSSPCALTEQTKT